MSFLPEPEAPGPNPGQPGHYADHEWLTLAVNALDDALLALSAGGGGGGEGGGGGPIGTIYPYAGDVAPGGHLLCDGADISRNAYPVLYSVIGTKYGSGDGSTTFGLPDFRNRVALGASATHPSGQEGGAETHTLLTSEMPSHSHAGITGGDNAEHTHSGGTSDMSANHSHAVGIQSGGRSAAHSHNVPAGGGNRTSGGSANTMIPGNGPTVTTTESADHSHHVGGGTDWGNSGHTHSFTTSGRSAGHAHGVTAEGGGAAFDKMPPYLAVTYIIRAV